ncbi:MAG: orotidine 5'-phosphate decarboxylase, partial [Dehalococcoidia bacterium]|nr:orotidine 5'-phosphate decarboxylase [Dehalococcoidia bacterium]
MTDVLPFREKVQQSALKRNSLLCIGLDPDPEKIPLADVGAFHRAIIEATSDIACAYKPNFAFFEAMGAAGYEALAQTSKPSLA